MELPKLLKRPTWLRLLTQFTHSPTVKVCLGLALALIGLLEILEDVFVELETVFETHHAVLLFGIVTGLRGVAEFVEGLEVFEHGLEEKHVRSTPNDQSSV